MKDPQEALEAARRQAGEVRAGGGYEEQPPSFDAAPVTRVSDKRLLEWAIIEPDLGRIYSTRRLGKPITWVKRLLARALHQYNDEVLGQQSRFNAHIAAHVLNLDERMRALEDAARERGHTEPR